MTTDEINKLLKPLLPKDKRTFVGIEKKCVFYDYGFSIGLPVTIKGVHFDADGIMMKCKGRSSLDLIVPIENLFQNYMQMYEKFGDVIQSLDAEWQKRLAFALQTDNKYNIKLYSRMLFLAHKLKRLHDKKLIKKDNRQ